MLMWARYALTPCPVERSETGEPRAAGLRALGRLLRHEQAGFFADPQILAVAVGGIQRLVDQAHVPITAVGNVDHVPPLPLKMRQTHQKMKLSRRIGLEVAAGALRETRQNVAGIGLLGFHTFSS